MLDFYLFRKSVGSDAFQHLAILPVKYELRPEIYANTKLLGLGNLGKSVRLKSLISARSLNIATILIHVCRAVQSFTGP